VASAVFYGAWDWRFLGLLYFSVLLDYGCGAQIARSRTNRRKRAFLLLSVAVNLGVLGFFKYFNFFTESFVELVSLAGFESGFHPWNIVLPLGISFYTFQSMSYTIDVYRGDSEPVKNFTDFALYVTFFPQLVAGPIERATTLLPQIVSSRDMRWSDLREGSFLVLSGFFKKIVIADNLARYVEYVFDSEHPESIAGFNVLLGLYCFAFQIYGDFAGYTDIARGVAKWMGFDLQVNFRRPYLAPSPSEYWKRWHISLTTWLRDYLYIPLGGSRCSSGKVYRNVFLTMTIGGLWHGAAGHFVVWGAVWGILLVVNRMRTEIFTWRIGVGVGAKTVGRIVSVLLTFHITLFLKMLFRVPSMDVFWTLSSRLFGDFQPDEMARSMLSALVYYVVPYLVFEIVEEVLAKGKNEDVKPRWWLRTPQAAFMIALLISHGALDGARFIYFQF
jgi:D-alanyl-lipoteichoic acid acyltransferase DltB (MBOAT superfamily)